MLGTLLLAKTKHFKTYWYLKNHNYFLQDGMAMMPILGRIPLLLPFVFLTAYLLTITNNLRENCLIIHKSILFIYENTCFNDLLIFIKSVGGQAVVCVVLIIVTRHLNMFIEKNNVLFGKPTCTTRNSNKSTIMYTLEIIAGNENVFDWHVILSLKNPRFYEKISHKNGHQYNSMQNKYLNWQSHARHNSSDEEWFVAACSTIKTWSWWYVNYFRRKNSCTTIMVAIEKTVIIIGIKKQILPYKLAIIKLITKKFASY